MGEQPSAVGELWQKARQSLEVSQELLGQEQWDYAATSAYHAAFFAASALLLRGGKSFAAHAAVRAYLHTHYVRRGILSRGAAAAYNALFALCDAGGRGVAKQVAPEKARGAVGEAGLFLAAVEAILRADPTGH